MRSGLVLPELLIAMIVSAIIAAIALPHLISVADAAAVRDEALRLVAALDATRGAAARFGAVATLRLGSTSYNASIVIGPDTIAAWSAPGPAQSGVTVSGTGQPILFGPGGLAMGVSNRTMTLSKGDVLRRVVISKLGRVSY